MKLYDVPRRTRIRVLEEVTGPPGSTPVKRGEILFFHHVDGMYSFCTTREKFKEEDIRHLPAWTEVEIMKPKDNGN